MKLPFRVQLSFDYAIASFVLSLLFGLLLYGAMRYELNEVLKHDLHVRADGIRILMQEKFSRGDEQGLIARLEEIDSLNHNQYLELFDVNADRWIYRSSALKGSTDQHFTEKPESFSDVKVTKKPVRLMEKRLDLNRKTYILRIGVDRHEYNEMLHHLGALLLLGLPFAIVASACTGYLMSRRSLKPISVITDTARAIHGGSLDRRLPETGINDELDQLSSVLNAMLERLQSAFARITQFTADASHELRTPLTLMRGHAEMITTEAMLERAQAKGTVIVEEADRMERLIADLLSLAREGDATRAPMLRLQANEIAARAVRYVQDTAENRAIHLTLRVDDREPVIMGHAMSLERLMVILLDNALRYTSPRGAVDVYVSTEDKMCLFSVRDNGCGIEAEHLEHIFERFYRIDASRHRESGGTGLGLALAKSIAEAHGGSITVASTKGVGSTFSVHLPLL